MLSEHPDELHKTNSWSVPYVQTKALMPLWKLSITLHNIERAKSLRRGHVNLYICEVLFAQCALDALCTTSCQALQLSACLPRIQAPERDSLALQLWRSCPEQHGTDPKGAGGLLCCSLQILQRYQRVILLHHLWQPELFRPPFSLNHRSHSNCFLHVSIAFAFESNFTVRKVTAGFLPMV